MTPIFNRLLRKSETNDDVSHSDPTSLEDDGAFNGAVEAASNADEELDDQAFFQQKTTTVNAAGNISATETVDTSFATKFKNVMKGIGYAVISAAIGLALAYFAYSVGRSNERQLAETEINGIIHRNYEAPMDWSRMPKWTNAADPSFRQQVASEANKFGGSAFDQLAMGLHERDNGDITKAYFYLTLSAARGQPYARSLRDQLLMTQKARDTALDDATKAFFYGGADANFLLGMLYLGDSVFDLARKPNTQWCLNGLTSVLREERTWPPCEENFGLPGAARVPWPNDLLGAAGKDQDAYLSFARAAQCFHPEAPLWLNVMENSGRIDQATAKNLRAQASNQVQNGGNREEFCNGGLWVKGAPRNGRGRASPGAAASAAAYCELETGDGVSRAQRDRPGRSNYDPADDPIARCAKDEKGNKRDPACVDTKYDSDAALEAADMARVCLRMGDAMLAAGDVDFALQYFRASIARGRLYGAQASVIASERLRALSLSCEYTTASLARISRGSKGSDFINIIDRQRALKALGFYRGRVDGNYGAGTRGAVREFQRGIGFDETGVMSPLETVILICQAAENRADVDSQNLLGVMYAAGLGVVQSTDLALQWLDSAANRGSPDAAYNLALLYSTGTILSSYRLCDRRFNDEVAKGYYEDAVRYGHPQARSESFNSFQKRVRKETNTGLETVTPSCGDAQGGNQND